MGVMEFCPHNPFHVQEFIPFFIPGVPDEPPIVPKRDGLMDNWNGWYPQCKPGIEAPWDGVTWGQALSVFPANFSPYAPVLFGKAYPLAKNELFPIIKKVRALLGRDFYGFELLHNLTTTGGKINFTNSDAYHLIGDFAGGFEDKPVIALQEGTAA
jgi:hypothetical protein